MTRSRLSSPAFCICLALLGATLLLPVGRVAAQFRLRGELAAQKTGKGQRPFPPPRSAPAAEPSAEPLINEQAIAADNLDAALTLAPDDTQQQTEELKVDDNSIERVYFQDGLIMLNRLTPSAYPAKLEQLRIAYGRVANEPDPTGQPVTLLIYADPSGAGQLPANPQFIRIPQTISNINTYAVPDGPTITSGDFYVVINSARRATARPLRWIPIVRISSALFFDQQRR